MRVWLHLNDELPAIGSGRRTVEVVSVGRSYLRIKKPGARRAHKVSFQKWDQLEKIGTMSDRFDNMDMKELVEAYNAMADSEAGKAVMMEPVTKFATLQAGRVRCQNAELRIGLENRKGTDIVPAKKPKTAKPAAQKKPTTPKEPKAPKEKVDKTGQWAFRDGSNRAKLLARLRAGKGKPVTVKALIEATYDKYDDDLKGPFNMVMKGMFITIEKNKVKATITKTKQGEDICYALSEG